MPSEPPPSPEELARITDPDELLAGEDPGSVFIVDAVHWIRVYGELLALKDALLERADEMTRGMSDDAMKDAAIDQRFLRAQADRYRLRREYWATRAAELNSANQRTFGGDTSRMGTPPPKSAARTEARGHAREN